MVLITIVRAQGIDKEIENPVSVGVMCETFFLLYQDVIFIGLVSGAVFTSLFFHREKIRVKMFSLNK